LNGAVSKTVVGLWSTEGSNPSPSALQSQTTYKRWASYPRPTAPDRVSGANERQRAPTTPLTAGVHSPTILRTARRCLSLSQRPPPRSSGWPSTCPWLASAGLLAKPSTALHENPGDSDRVAAVSGTEARAARGSVACQRVTCFPPSARVGEGIERSACACVSRSGAGRRAPRSRVHSREPRMRLRG
jgi:hypothetical protein